ncbi:MAG: Ldh family oxidoreductase [Roseinatronobacter sp.]
MSDLAREEIRTRIITGSFQMGRKLRENDLAELLGMSKSPIREALLQLESEGLIEMPPDRTAHVFSMEPANISELGELRLMLEREALTLAMVRNRPKLIAALEAVLAQMADSLKSGDDARYRMLDLEFHSAVFEASENSYLRKTYMMLAFRIQALRNLLSRDAGLNQISFADHEGLIAAIKADDRDRALDLLQKHIGETTRNYLARMESEPVAPVTGTLRVQLPEMERFSRAALESVKADAQTVEAVTRALSHASGLGVDSHGYRLLPHYLEGLIRGRLNPRPSPRLISGKGGAGVLDADNAHGARAAYEAVALSIDRARTHGLGAIAICNSSHFGAAGAYAMAIAEAGMMGLAFCNSDSFVRLHSGAIRFHGTNPIAAAAPSDDAHPWLLDMATSSIPFNRVQLARSLGLDLASEVAADINGQFVTDPAKVEMLAPLGGALFGYKGAGLAGLAEILSTAFSDAPLSVEIPEMISEDMETPRRLGAFVLALDPDAFSGAAVFRRVVARYGEAVRRSPRAGSDPVLAAGDREWAEGERRRAAGIKLDAETLNALNRFAVERSLQPLQPVPEEGAG